MKAVKQVESKVHPLILKSSKRETWSAYPQNGGRNIEMKIGYWEKCIQRPGRDRDIGILYYYSLFLELYSTLHYFSIFFCNGPVASRGLICDWIPFRSENGRCRGESQLRQIFHDLRSWSCGLPYIVNGFHGVFRELNITSGLAGARLPKMTSLPHE